MRKIIGVLAGLALFAAGFNPLSAGNIQLEYSTYLGGDGQDGES